MSTARMPRENMVPVRPRKSPKRRPRRDHRAVRRAQNTASAILAVSGATLVTIGTIAWATPRQSPELLQRAVTHSLQATPWFDPGATIFTTPLPDGSIPAPERLDCVVRNGGRDKQLRQPADADQLGSRVQAGSSLVPVVVVGASGPGAELTCSGAYLANREVWLLPTLPSISAVPLSVVIGGVGCLGIGLLINPRARGSRN